MPAVASETKVAPFSSTPTARTSGRGSDGGDMFSALVDDSAPPKERSVPSRSADSRTDAPTRDRKTNQADDKPAAAEQAGDTPVKAKSNDTSAASSDTKVDAKGDGKTDAKTVIDGAAEQAAADAATTAGGTATDVQSDPAATVIPVIAAVIPTAPTGIALAGDATAAADTVLAANPAIGEIAAPTLKPQQAAGDAAQAQQTAPAVDPSTPDTDGDADASTPAAIPAAAHAKPGDAAEAKPAALAATPDDHPAAARHVADAAANDAAALKTDPTQTPQTLHTAQPANGTAPAAPAHTASTATASQPIPLHAVAVEIAARAGTGKNRFEIRLDPPELGKIDVRLDIDKHGQVTSRLIVEKAETLDLLRRDAPQLERALQDAGLKTSGNGLQFSLQQQMSQQRDDQPSGHVATAQMLVADETAATDIAARSYSSLAAARGGIDIRV